MIPESIHQPGSAAPLSQGKKGTEGRSHSILRTPHSAFKWALVLLPLAYLWFRLINNLWLEWTTNPQYGYGLLVPFLCIGLLIRRWLGEGKEKQKAESRKQPDEVVEDFTGQGKQPNEVTSPLEYGKDSTGHGNFTGQGPVKYAEDFTGQGLHGPRKPEGSSPPASDSFPISAFRISAFQFALFALLAFLYLPTRLIEAATPEWRPIQWSLGVIAIGLTLCVIYLGKGRGWSRQLAFPILFFFVAIPWPSLVEGPIIQNLTRVSAAVVIEALGWLGVPAMAHGNVIEVATGMVGIDEACSGIRSFQSSIMISLFLGELYGLNWFRRLLLMLFGFVCSMAFNVCRMALLTLIAAKKGVPAISQYHDPAGVTIAIACTVALWGLALLLRRQPGEVPGRLHGPRPGEVTSPLEYGKDSMGHGNFTGRGPVKYAEDFTGQGKQPGEVGARLHGPGKVESVGENVQSGKQKAEMGNEEAKSRIQKVENKNEFQLSAFSISAFKNVRGLAISLLIWLVLVEAGVELWYRHLESQLKPGPAWSLNFPQDNATLQDLPISADTRYLLRFDKGKQAAWTEADGTRWVVFYSSWLPGKVAGYLAKRHTPEICMQATGVKLVSGPELTMMNVHGVKLPVRSYVFETSSGLIQVFHCRWEAGVDESAYVQHESARFNLVRGIWAGRGNKGQKVLEIIISGMDDPAQARAALVRQLEKLITVSAVGAPNSDSAR